MIPAPAPNLYKALPGHSLLYWFTGPAAVGLGDRAGSGSNVPTDDTRAALAAEECRRSVGA